GCATRGGDESECGAARALEHGASVDVRRKEPIRSADEDALGLATRGAVFGTSVRRWCGGRKRIDDHRFLRRTSSASMPGGGALCFIHAHRSIAIFEPNTRSSSGGLATRGSPPVAARAC